MHITVFGTGYVGLVQGSVLAEVGHDVLCVDVDAPKVEALKAGPHPDLRARARGHRQEEPRRRAGSTSPPTPPTASRTAASQFIAVGTPARRGRLGRPASTCWRSRPPSPSTWRSPRSSSTSRPCRSAPPTRCAARIAEVLQARGARPRLRRGLEPGVPQGRRRGRRLHAPRPHRHRHLRPGEPRSCCARSTPRSTATTTRSSSWTCARPS